VCPNLTETEADIFMYNSSISNVMKIREALTEMDMGRGAEMDMGRGAEMDMGRGAEMNSRNAKRRRKLEKLTEWKQKNGGSRKEERGKKISKKNKDENSERQKQISKVYTKQRDRQKRREWRKRK
jgi:hypothetical protein